MVHVSAGAGAASVDPQVGEGPAGDYTVTRPSGCRAYRRNVVPVPRQAMPLPGRGAGAMVSIINPERAVELPAERIARRLRLTGAEAGIAAAHAAGTSLAEYPERPGIIIRTTRWTLKQALAKTGTDRQSGLIARVLRTAIVRSDSSDGKSRR